MEKVTIQQLTDEQISERGIRNWPVWEKEVSRFDWRYESDEQCLILEGEIVVETSDGKYHIKPGDFVTFKKDLSCIWEVKKPVRKHYNFK